jgi:hypothetical protein
MRPKHLLATLAFVALFASSGALALADTPPAGTASGMRTSGYYDHQVIEYVSSTFSAASVQAANLIAHGNVVYHIENPNGSTPAVQCVQNTALFPSDATDCNVLNFIPGEVGYAGGAWNLQIFHWSAPATVALTKDDDILAAVAAKQGTLEVTNILVRCPLVNFSNLR